MNLFDRWQSELNELTALGRYRSLNQPAGVDFSSNDYLGYSKKVWPHSNRSRSGTASRLLRGHDPIWDELEAKLAAWHGAESALMFSSGYVANEGLLSTICAAGDVVFSDQSNHASIIDGLRMSRAEKIVFPHNDVSRLGEAMRARHAKRSANQAWFIVTESLFGMEGDQAPLPEMADLARKYDAHLVVDEAHATGCFSDTGSGLVDSFGLRDHVLATMHTGGKALAVPGAYVAGSARLKKLLVNRCRHFIFTTALPPQIGAWWLDVLDVVVSDHAARQSLRRNSTVFCDCLREHGLQVPAAGYVVPVVIGSDQAAVARADRLQTLGFDVRAIRPPTVPPGAARLRISIHADHEEATLRELAGLLGE
ncbi:MAG: 8-amino-7-oxononanoate synthase [Planctomycetes bacterium]|nr:8-amino-7-oxononanoate synthase [Planctomycetota bacterium]